jgi:hypothetical protein
MDLSQINWFYVAIGLSALLLLIWFTVGVGSGAGVAARFVSLPFLLAAMVNTAAPVRALLDPDYANYGFGLLSATSAWTIVATSIGVVLIALTAAFAAITPGRWAKALTALIGLAFAANFAVPLARLSRAGPPPLRVTDQLTLPGLVALGLALAILVAPFLLAALWATRRLFSGR